MSYLVGNVDSSKPLDPGGKECPGSGSGSGSGSQHGPAPPFKRPRNQDDHASDSAAFAPMDQRTSQSQQNPLINKGTRNIFYKTRLCKKKMQGNCPNGEKCTFAHGLEELHDPPPNWKELVPANGNRALDNYRRAQHGMIVCRNFISEKGCPYGEYCFYLHRSPNNTEMARPLPMHLSAPSIETAGPMLEQRNDTGLSELMAHGSQRMPSVTMNRFITGKNMQLPLNSGGPNEDASPAKVTETKFLNWRPPRKIAGIYGDWPDGYSLPDNNQPNTMDP